MKLIDLVSGCGGMAPGFVDPRFCGGCECVLSLDRDSAASRSHAVNLGGRAVRRDIADVDEPPHADVVIRGPPCQGFSLLNRNRRRDARRSLWRPFLDVVMKADASAFVIENVPRLHGSPEHTAMAEPAGEPGFRLFSVVRSAADFGVPQTRRRTILLASADGSRHGRPGRRIRRMEGWRCRRGEPSGTPSAIFRRRKERMSVRSRRLLTFISAGGCRTSPWREFAPCLPAATGSICKGTRRS